MFIGIILVILGVLLLLNQLGLIAWHNWGILWPIILVALGARMIMTSQKKKEDSNRLP